MEHPVGLFVVIVKVTGPEDILGVYVADTVIGLVLEVTILLKAPLVAVQVAEVALPVSVPATIMEPFEQTDCVLEFTTTPVNKFMFIDLFAFVIDVVPHGFIAVADTV